jgi:hypothetical protein
LSSDVVVMSGEPFSSLFEPNKKPPAMTGGFDI